jgi:hypothetical protein
LIKTGIGKGKIPECSMTFEIVAEEAIRSRELVDQYETKIRELQKENNTFKDRNLDIE